MTLTGRTGEESSLADDASDEGELTLTRSLSLRKANVTFDVE